MERTFDFIVKNSMMHVLKVLLFIVLENYNENLLLHKPDFIFDATCIYIFTHFEIIGMILTQYKIACNLVKTNLIRGKLLVA